jgi:TolA-binding protein
LPLSIKRIKNFKKTKNDKGPSPVIFLILLSFSLLLLNGCLFSPFSKGSVEGYIHEETVIDTRSLEGALVSITGSSNTALTDADGFFRIDEVSIGSRTLTITKESYITYKILSVVIKKDEVTLIDNGNPIVIRAVDDKYFFDGGIIYYDSSEYTNALITFQQLINEFPDSQYADDAQYYIAYINEKKLGYYIQALLEYQELINNFPDSPYADDAYQKLIDNYPESSLLALAQYSIAQSYRKLTNYEQAILEFTKVIENYPESDYTASAQYYIGYSHYQAQDYSQAILEFQKTIDNYPDSTWPGEPERLIAPCAQYYIGWCYGQKLEQWNDAISTFQLVIDNYPNSTWSSGNEIPPDAQYQIGWCYEQLELWCEAIDAYQLVIDNYPGTSWSNFAEERINAISENCPPS